MMRTDLQKHAQATFRKLLVHDIVNNDLHLPTRTAEYPEACIYAPVGYTIIHSALCPFMKSAL